MKRRSKILIYSTLLLLIVIVTILMGIPSRLSNREISKETFDQIKEVQTILSANVDKLKKSKYSEDSKQLIDGYGFITTPEAIDNLFESLTNDERQKIKLLFISKKIRRINMSRPKCIEFLIEYSQSNFLFNSSSESLWLIHNDACNCACENNVNGEKSESVESLGSAWFKVITKDRRRLPTC